MDHVGGAGFFVATRQLLIATCRAGFAPVNTPERIARLVYACPESCAD